MLNILFVIYHDFGNSFIQVHNFANALTERGHECVVAVPENTATTRQSIGEIMLYTLLTYAETLNLTCVFSNGNPPDIIHAWTPRELVRKHVLLLKNRLSSSRVLVHLEDNEEYLVEKHTGVPIEELRLLSDARLREINFNHLSHPKLYKTFLKNADGITIIMERLLEFAPEQHPHLLLWPILDTKKFNYKDKDRTLQKSLGISDQEFVITYTGNVHAANAHEVRSLYLAVALANREGIPTRLVRTGNDHYNFLREQTAWAHQYSVELGFVAAEKIPSLLSLSDMLIQPGKADRFNDYRLPSKLPEFLATGKPVALPASNLGHLLQDREEAIILKKGDGLDILEVIKDIRNHPELAERLSQGGRNFAVKHFSRKTIGKKLEDFYVQIVQQRPTSKISSDRQPFFERYKTYEVPELSYAAVRDYCDSRNHLADLSQHGDLKNVQRPWAVKAIVSKVPQGGKLLEIGAGEPVVANFLYELGYDVTVIDPYDGSGNGPTEYALYKQQYPHLKIIRQHFDATIAGLSSSSMDCIYSISVLEHVPDDNIYQLFETIAKYLRPNGVALHAIDHVLMGEGDKFHEQKLRLILQELNLESNFDEVIEKVKNDVDTYFLSAESYYLWKGAKTLEEYPFRKVISINICTYPHKKTQQTQQQLTISSSPNESYDTSTNPWNADQPFSYKGMWLNSKEYIKHINKEISGDENMHWLFYFMNQYLAPALGWKETHKQRELYRCLILGSNEGYIAQTLCEKGFIGQIVASDIAEKALVRSKKKITALGYSNVEFVQADLNTDSFDGTFDFIIAEGVLHHIEDINRCLRMLESTLNDNGVMVMVEFEGAKRFQLPEKQVRWINAALNVLPKSLRPFPLNSDKFLPATLEDISRVHYVPPTEEQMMKFDPSEALSGFQLKRLLPKIFQIVERKGYGGTVISYITGHFDFERANDDDFAKAWLNVLIQIEDTLINTGILEDDFVFYVVKRKK